MVRTLTGRCVIVLAVAAPFGACVAAGCAEIIGADFDKPFKDAGRGGSDGGSHLDAGHPRRHADASVLDSGCALVEETFLATSDVELVDLPDCGVPPGLANQAVIDLAVGRGLFRFPLSASAVAALSSPFSIASLTLTLPEATACTLAADGGVDAGAVGDGGAPPDAGGDAGARTCFTGGSLLAYPLRDGWLGNGSTQVDGAALAPSTWCARTSGVPWDSPGASGVNDHGSTAASVVFDGTESPLTVPLTPSVFTPWIADAPASISVLLVAQGHLSAKLAAATSGALPHPKLAVSYCLGEQ